MKTSLGWFRCLEGDIRALVLISSFLDSSGFTATCILDELRALDLPSGVKMGLEALSDFERSHGQAVEHLLVQLSVVDANIKLHRRSNLIPHLDLHQSLHDKAYQLPFSQSGHDLFGENLQKVLAINEELSSKKFTRNLEKATLQSLKQTTRPESRASSTSSRSSSSKKGGG